MKGNSYIYAILHEFMTCAFKRHSLSVTLLSLSNELTFIQKEHKHLQSQYELHFVNFSSKVSLFAARMPCLLQTNPFALNANMSRWWNFNKASLGSRSRLLVDWRFILTKSFHIYFFYNRIQMCNPINCTVLSKLTMIVLRLQNEPVMRFN